MTESVVAICFDEIKLMTEIDKISCEISCEEIFNKFSHKQIMKCLFFGSYLLLDWYLLKQKQSTNGRKLYADKIAFY